MNTKSQVVNPIKYFTTIGEEIEDILSSNDISIEKFLNQMTWNGKDLKSISKISKAEAMKFEKIINISNISSYILNFQNEYKKCVLDANETYKKHLKIYKKINHISSLLRNEFNSGLDQLEDISDFLGIDDEEEILNRVHENIALYKISGFHVDSLNLYAWLKRGEIDFFNKSDLSTYNKTEFLNWVNSYEWKSNLYDHEYISSLPCILEKFGVGLVYTHFLEKTVFGAVRWFDNKPLVQVSDRNKCMATFWYTLFHEFGHVIKHENDEIFEGTLDLPQSKINQKEKEANSFAYEHLFKGDNLRRYIFGFRGQFVSDAFINDTAKSFNVDKMFVAYWMKKAAVRSKTIKENIPYIEFI